MRHRPSGIVAKAEDTPHHEGVSQLRDVIDAWKAIGAAELNYRAVLRKALANGVQQVEVAKALDRTREMIRRDAMTEDQREALRKAEAERKRARKAARTRTG